MGVLEVWEEEGFWIQAEGQSPPHSLPRELFVCDDAQRGGGEEVYLLETPSQPSSACRQCETSLAPRKNSCNRGTEEIIAGDCDVLFDRISPGTYHRL